MFTCVLKSLFFVNFGFFAAALGMMTRKPIKINRSSFLTVVFLDVKLYNARKKKIKKNRARSSSLPLCARERSSIRIKERKEKREKGFKVFAFFSLSSVLMKSRTWFALVLLKKKATTSTPKKKKK